MVDKLGKHCLMFVIKFESALHFSGPLRLDLVAETIELNFDFASRRGAPSSSLHLRALTEAKDLIQGIK